MPCQSVVLCTLVINEREWLDTLYQQHRSWPGLVGWVFVEASDVVYARANPSLVDTFGLSTDGTTEYLETLAKSDKRVTHIKHGFSSHKDLAQGKCQARQKYLEECDKIRPKYFVVLDADEFYTYEDQRIMGDFILRHKTPDGITFPRREIWKPPLDTNLLFSSEVVGGYWAIPHTRCWRWEKGLQYTNNHNNPYTNRGYAIWAPPVPNTKEELQRQVVKPLRVPYCIHLGFASSLKNRQAKHLYYTQRGEGTTDKRGWYVESRRAWETWRPGDTLPQGARVIPYTGPIPEVIKDSMPVRVCRTGTINTPPTNQRSMS